METLEEAHLTPKLHGKAWFGMDLAALKCCAAQGRSLEDTAAILCRSIDEVARKAGELGLQFS